MLPISAALALLAINAVSGPPILQPGAPGEPSREISVEQSRALSVTRHTEADTRFMQHMIVHHQQAVDMVALIEGRTDNAQLIALGGRISRSQDDEMTMMRGWLEQRGEAVEADDLHAHHSHAGHHGHTGHAATDPDDVPLMTGMLSANQMRALEAAEGAQFDRLFLEGMIHHHEGALLMVDELIAEPGAAEDIIMSDFTGHIVADQTAEILRMQAMLAEMPAEAGEPEGDSASGHHHHHHNH
ncbi:MAG: DUF305 domain-containing protein [Caulobacterales bacterium]|uniref:DUF305 domain-containing protein n=1 Tax=Glycocaulis sp. TaxID=1969725 RepID=UPI003FA0EC63